MLEINTLTQYLATLLQVDKFKDYCPNGLQVAGLGEVKKIATGVTANMALLEAAVAQGAEAVLVHHGYFWRNEDPCVVGLKRNRLAFLLKHNVHLLAYHLPLDMHAIYGNNVQLGGVLQLSNIQFGGENNMIAFADLPQSISLEAVAKRVSTALNRTPLLLGDPTKQVQKIAWCTGAAQNYFEQAVALGADVYISGEVSEQTTHIAHETGVGYIAAGHHATERYGVQALGAHLAEKFNISHVFIDIDNPV